MENISMFYKLARRTNVVNLQRKIGTKLHQSRDKPKKTQTKVLKLNFDVNTVYTFKRI